MAVWVVRTEDDGQPVQGVFVELQTCRARIGWSWGDDQDLRLIARGEPLNEDQRNAKRCLRFLTEVQPQDYLLYPNQPVIGSFSVVQVEGEYSYSARNEGVGPDFRSYRPCSLVTPEPVDMRDEIVSSQLRHRLGRPGRFSRVYDTIPFYRFLEDIENAGQRQDGSVRMQVQRIHGDLRRNLPHALRREFGRADLSRVFCAELFERMGYSSDVQEGPAEHGSDVVVTVDDPLLPNEGVQIGVQAFSYEDPVDAPALQEKLNQLLAGWEVNLLDYGVLLTTGRCSEGAKAVVSAHNGESPNKRVRLIDGDELADLFLKYFPPTPE